MPTINVIPSWNVKKLFDDQPLVGTIYANGVYKFTFTRDNVQSSVVMAIKEITPVIPEGAEEPIDYKIVPSVIFFENGFDAEDSLKEEDTILLSEVDEVEREFIKYEALDRAQRRKSTDEDPFVFNFINPKTSKPFRIMVDHDHFVGIPALTKKGDVHTNFGYIDHIETDPESGLVTKIIMDSVLSTRGVFRGSKTIIPYDKLRGIYHYMIVIEPHKGKKADAIVSTEPETPLSEEPVEITPAE
mgnify:FL=1